MNSAKKNKKKINEYTFEDIKEIFSENLRKISSKIILLEIGNDFLNIGLAKSRNNKLYIKKVFKQTLPKEALESHYQLNQKILVLLYVKLLMKIKLQLIELHYLFPLMHVIQD